MTNIKDDGLNDESLEEEVYVDPEDAEQNEVIVEDTLMEEEDENNQQENIIDDSIQAFYTHRKPIYAVDLHPIDSTIVVSGGEDEMGYLWRTTSATDGTKDEIIASLSGHTDSIIDAKFSKNLGTYVATGGMDGKIQVWKIIMENGKVNGAEFSVNLEPSEEVIWIDWHPQGNVILGGLKDGNIWMWLVPSGTVMQVFSGHSDSVMSGCFTPDGKNILSGSDDGIIIFWDPKTGSAIWRIDTSNDTRFDIGSSIFSLSINITSSLAVAGGANDRALLINLRNGTPLAALTHTDIKVEDKDKEITSSNTNTNTDTEMDQVANSIEAIGFCDILPLVVTSSVDGKICIWDTSTMKLRSFAMQDDAITSLKFIPGTPFFITTSNDHTVRRYDVRTGRENRVWQGHQDSVLVCAVSKDGNVIVSGGDDGVLLVWPPS